MGLVVKKPGVITTIQDNGRFGYQGSGFSTNGVMDHRAFAIANLLVENEPGAPVLEFALAGPTVRFTTNTCIAITGGDFAPTLDGEPIPSYAAIMVRRGSILRFKASRTGCYGYLAIAGNSVRVDEVMGSRSTNLKCEFGGWKGRALIVGDYLPFSTKSVDFLPNLGSHRIDGDGEFYGFDRDEVTVRVVPGPQQDMFTEEGLATFYGQAYTNTTKCDRRKSPRNTVPISFPTACRSAPCRCRPTGGPSSCWPTVKPRAATRKSARSPAWTSRSSCSGPRAARCASSPSACRKRRRCCARRRTCSRCWR